MGTVSLSPIECPFWSRSELNASYEVSVFVSEYCSDPVIFGKWPAFVSLASWRKASELSDAAASEKLFSVANLTQSCRLLGVGGTIGKLDLSGETLWYGCPVKTSRASNLIPTLPS